MPMLTNVMCAICAQAQLEASNLAGERCFSVREQKGMGCELSWRRVASVFLCGDCMVCTWGHLPLSGVAFTLQQHLCCEHLALML